MLELLLLSAWIVGSLRAWRSAETRLVTAVGVLALYLFAAEVASVCAYEGVLVPNQVFALMFLGPSSWMTRADGLLPLSGLFVSHPLVLRGARVCTCAAVAQLLWLRSARLHPYLPRTELLERVAMPFFGAASLDGVELVIMMLADSASTI